jgi:hypothetical protein
MQALRKAPGQKVHLYAKLRVWMLHSRTDGHRWK